jgi:DMSO/TMAO reductase YedYZ heme-binding membrane subunit
MKIDLNTALKHRAINGWGLFFLISVPVSSIIAVAMMKADLSTGEGVTPMISYAVRWAVPFIFLAVAASSFNVLFPGPFSRWWLRNRPYIGMCFAVAMAWQASFIFILSTYFRPYYLDQIYLFRDELEGTIGYIFLAAMVVTSFQFGRKYVDQKQWKLVHRGGLYFLWAYPFSVYWWNLFYYPTQDPFTDPRMIDYVFYCMGFLAFALRIAAWGKKRQQAAQKSAPEGHTPAVFKMLGGVIVALGLVASATGLQWQATVSAFLTGPAWSAKLELWLPFWPLEPFLPLFIIGLGTMLATTTRSRVEAQIDLA